MFAELCPNSVYLPAQLPQGTCWIAVFRQPGRRRATIYVYSPPTTRRCDCYVENRDMAPSRPAGPPPPGVDVLRQNCQDVREALSKCALGGIVTVALRLPRPAKSQSLVQDYASARVADNPGRSHCLRGVCTNWKKWGKPWKSFSRNKNGCKADDPTCKTCHCAYSADWWVHTHYWQKHRVHIQQRKKRHTTHQRSRPTICKGGMASVTRTLVRCAVSKSTVVRFVEHAFRIRLAAVRKLLSWITTMRPRLCVGCSVTDATSAWAVFTTMRCS